MTQRQVAIRKTNKNKTQPQQTKIKPESHNLIFDISYPQIHRMGEGRNTLFTTQKLETLIEVIGRSDH